MPVAVPFDVTLRTLRISRFCTITRKDGVVLRVTDAQRSITTGGHTYLANSGATISAVKRAVGADSSAQIDAFATAGGVFDLYDIANKKFDFATVEITAFSRADPTQTSLRFSGHVTKVMLSPIDGAVNLQAEGVSIKASAPFVPMAGAMCRTDLGSRLCTIPILPADLLRSTDYQAGDTARFRFAGAGDPSDYANRYLLCTEGGTTASGAPTISSTISSTATDGSVVWETMDAWTRYGKILITSGSFTITLDRDVDARAVDGWYQNGMIIMRSGYSANQAFEISSWVQSTRALTTFMPANGANAQLLYGPGDWLEIVPGCDKVVDSGNGCTKFSNTLNFQGEPFYLGTVNASQAPAQ